MAGLQVLEIASDKRVKNTTVWQPSCPYRGRGKEGRL
jgi:hypothetical protein